MLKDAETRYFSKMRRAIITGATGFVGFALLLELLRNNYFVYVLCRRDSRRADRLKGLENIEVIDANLSTITDIPSAVDCDVFFHLAWGGGRNDFDAQYKNIAATLNCLKLSAKLGAKLFLCTGSQAEYGETAERITEKTHENPVTSYGAAKTAAYYLARDLSKQLNIPMIWARLFSVYGEHDNVNSLVPSVLRALKEHGSAQLETDGTQIWNYLHETDAARALRLLGESGASGVFNVASMTSMPLRDYMKKISDKITFGNKKNGVNLNVRIDKLLSAIVEWKAVDFSTAIREMMR